MENVILSGTHTHSGPGGYQQYLLLSFTTLGFVDQAYESLVTGITQVSKLAIHLSNLMLELLGNCLASSTHQCHILTLLLSVHYKSAR